jgi:Rod binding domain-containing protein
VFVDTVTTDGEQAVTDNIKRKARDMEQMFSMLVKFMNNTYEPKKQETFDKPVDLPKWLMAG